MSGECDKSTDDCKCHKGLKRVPNSMGYKFNMFRNVLKNLPNGKIEIVLEDPKDKEIADQLSKTTNYFGKEVYLNGPIVCKVCEKEPMDCECEYVSRLKNDTD